MKYNQPYGVSDPNAPYINGNPSTGTMGSIPPAASIEYPQRELANFISSSSLTPSDADLYQLAKSVQSGVVTYGLDVGTPNQISIFPAPAVTTYYPGMRFIVRVAYGNTSQVTFNVSNHGAVPVVKTDLQPLLAYELTAGQLIEVAYDAPANRWQILAGATKGAVTMSAPQHIYVNDLIGSDTAYDGTSAAVSGVMGGPFKTLQKALATMQKYNLGGWSFYIHVADGNYNNTSPITFPTPNGSGWGMLVGNTSNPAAVTFTNTGTGSAWMPDQGGNWSLEGFKLVTTAPAPGDGGDGIRAGRVFLSIGNMHWGAMTPGYGTGAHFSIGGAGTALVYGTQTIVGNAFAHNFVYANGILYNNGPIPFMPHLVVPAPVTINRFINCVDGGQARPTYDTITGAGNVTGSKFAASGNGVIQTGGAGTSYLPGSIAGTTASGGQYL